MECVRVANAKGLYGFSRTFKTLTSTLRSSESCTAFLIDCTHQDNPTNAHLNRLRALREMLQGNIKLKLGKEGVLFLLKGPVKPIDLHS